MIDNVDDYKRITLLRFDGGISFDNVSVIMRQPCYYVLLSGVCVCVNYIVANRNRIMRSIFADLYCAFSRDGQLCVRCLELLKCDVLLKSG